NLFLAPQWNERLIRAEFGALRQFGKMPLESIKAQRLMIGPLARGVGVAMVGSFIFAQVLNLLTRGKPTWQNEEEGPESKISGYIPDVIGGGPGFFFNPSVLPMEYTHLVLNGAARHDGNFLEALEDIGQSRLGPVRVLETLI